LATLRLVDFQRLQQTKINVIICHER
jgi:hypothetical protein